jgi:hypothetical protein
MELGHDAENLHSVIASIFEVNHRKIMFGNWENIVYYSRGLSFFAF